MNKDNILNIDVLIVGAGPSGLSTAIHLADILKQRGIERSIMVVEKGQDVGSHILSGALIKTDALRELLSNEEFENIPFDSEVKNDSAIKLSQNGSFKIPFHLPYMNNIGNKIASLCQICKYLSDLAKQKGVHVFSGFAVNEMLYDNNKVIGVKTMDTGIDEHGVKQKNYQEGTSVIAKVVVLAEGPRGYLSRQVKDKFNLRKNSNPQVYSLGFKELWNVKEGSIKEGDVFHTFGYPLNVSDEFGGGFIYGLKDNKVAIGFAIGLDYEDPTLDTHGMFQVWKQHPFVKNILKEGTLLEYGAKTIPEGGWNSISELHVDNLLIVGDSAGFVAMPALKGVHLSVTSGICAAKTIVNALEKNDTSSQSLSMYKTLINGSRIKEELYPVRNFRAVMSQGLFIGGLKFGVQLLTNGFCLLTPKVQKDSLTTKKLQDFRGLSFKERFKNKLKPDKQITFDKDTSVFYSDISHEEEQENHLHVKDLDSYNKSNIKEYGMPAQYFCPANVYEEHVDKEKQHSLKIHAENCIHCKTCDIKTPNDAITWTTPYGGDGPQYKNM